MHYENLPAKLRAEKIDPRVPWLYGFELDFCFRWCQINEPQKIAARSARGMGRDGFHREPMTTRAVEKLIDRYVAALGLDPNVTVHSLRVTALTTARERGSDIIDLQDFAGHADPRTTLTYIRTRDRLSQSPAYVLKY